MAMQIKHEMETTLEFMSGLGGYLTPIMEAHEMETGTVV